MVDSKIKVQGYSIPKIVKETVKEEDKIFNIKLCVKVEQMGEERSIKSPIEIVQSGKKFKCPCGETHASMNECVACCTGSMASGLVK